MRWTPATEPPIMYQDNFGCFTSKPVLVYVKGKGSARRMLVATLEKWDDELKPTWYSSCSERWNLYNSVLFWTPLPNPPKDQP